MKITQKPWGFEVNIFTWNQWRLKILHVKDGNRTSLQYHTEKEEFWFFNDGTWRHLSPKEIHRLNGPITVLEIARGKDSDIVRLEDDYQRDNAGV